MKLKQLSMLGLAVAAVVSSCTIEKRVAMPGYHVEWKSARTVAHTEKTEDSKEDKIKVNENFALQKAENQKVKTSEITASKDEVTVIAEEVAVNDVVSTPLVEKEAAVSVPTAKEAKTAAKATKVQQKEQVKAAKKMLKKELKKNQASDDKVLLYILCFLIPFLAVGLATDWDVKTVVINLLWTLLCGIPGIIHAIIVVKRS